MGYIPKVWTSQFLSLDSVWVPSSYTASMFLAHGSIDRSKVRVIPHGIDCEIKQSTNTDNMRQKFNISPSTCLFLYIGAILPRKGIDILMSGWCAAFNRKHDVVLILKLSYSHGGGYLKNMIRDAERNMACGKVIVVQSHYTSVESFYRAADVYVHPSKAEGFGLTPLEALGAGKFVIASGRGAGMDFLSPVTSSLVRSKKRVCESFPCSNNTLCVFQNPLKQTDYSFCETLEGDPFWYEMELDIFRDALRDSHKNRKRNYAVAMSAQSFVCEHFSWKTISAVVVAELVRIVNNGSLFFRAQSRQNHYPLIWEHIREERDNIDCDVCMM